MAYVVDGRGARCKSLLGEIACGWILAPTVRERCSQDSTPKSPSLVAPEVIARKFVCSRETSPPMRDSWTPMIWYPAVARAPSKYSILLLGFNPSFLARLTPAGSSVFTYADATLSTVGVVVCPWRCGVGIPLFVSLQWVLLLWSLLL